MLHTCNGIDYKGYSNMRHDMRARAEICSLKADAGGDVSKLIVAANFLSSYRSPLLTALLGAASEIWL